MAWKITVSAGPHTRRQCPVEVEVPGAAVTGDSAIPVDSAAVLNGIVQGMSTERGASLRFVLSRLDAGATASFIVDFGKSVAGGRSGVQVDATTPESVSIRIDDTPFTTLVADPEGVRPFFYPVLGPGGVAVTRNYPMKSGIAGEAEDHPHHRSFYVAHGDVNGEDVWSETQGHGRQTQEEVVTARSGPVVGTLETRNVWRGADGKPLVADRRRFEFFSAGPDVRLLDATLTFRAEFGEVVFGDTKEGGLLTFRVAGTMKGKAGGCIENAWGGIGEAECWGKAAPWVDYSGPVGDALLGIAVMDHPMNLRHPSRWHVRDYGLFAVNPFALSYYKAGFERDGTFRLAPDEDLVFRYRVLIHPGATRQAGVGEHFVNYIHPPKATVESMSVE